jgi:hypothetical protein
MGDPWNFDCIVGCSIFALPKEKQLTVNTIAGWKIALYGTYTIREL